MAVKGRIVCLMKDTLVGPAAKIIAIADALARVAISRHHREPEQVHIA
jgi:hypothetical protein